MMRILDVQSSVLSDQGRSRSHNQDTVRICEPGDPSTLLQLGRLYIVADGAGGVGGSRAGKLASRYAASKVRDLYYRSAGGNPGVQLRNAMLTANDAIRAHVARPGRASRMATTMVAAVIRGDELTVANVGDSRAYLWRDNAIWQVTEDHSLVAGLLADGVISKEEAADHPQRNVILHSLGGAPHDPRIDVFTHKLRPDDRVLLCTDGLTRYADGDRLGLMLQREPVDRVARRLIDFANQAGGSDNVSVAVLRVLRARRSGIRRWVWWFLLLIGIALIGLSGLFGWVLMQGL